ncbi:MAG: hypothetical protein ACP5MV_00945 [Candidatus Parvarchaeum sp.]
MKAAARKNVYIFSFFLLFMIFIGFVLFLVLVESGIISFHTQSITVSGFSCTSSGTVINVYKDIEQPANITNVILTVGNVQHSLLNSNLEIRGGEGYYSFDFPYRCFSVNEELQASVYYESYSSAFQSLNTGNDFFSSLISNTRA